MFDVLVYVYEHYWRGEACPELPLLSRKLSAAGFDADEIEQALSWLAGLNIAAQADIIPAIHDAALEYADARDRHVEATKAKAQAAEDLADAMRKAKKTFYEHGNVTAKLKDTQKVLVKVKSEPAE